MIMQQSAKKMSPQNAMFVKGLLPPASLPGNGWIELGNLLK